MAARRKPGASIPDAERHTVKRTLRLTPTESAALDAVAKARGVNVSRAVGALAVEAMPSASKAAASALRGVVDITFLKERLGERIRSLRTEQKLGLRETALKIGISPTYLSRIETLDEKTPPAEDVIRKLATLLNDDFDELMHLAGRVPEDVEKVIKGDPSMPAFLRTAKEQKLSGDDLMKLIEAQKKGKSQRVARGGGAGGGGVRAEEAGRVPIEETIAAIVEITIDRPE